MRDAWQGVWDGRGPGARLARALLLPLEGLFRAGVWLRNRAYDHGWLSVAEPEIPVLSVGNLTVGGTGKTPVTSWLVGALVDVGANPAVISRGYGMDEVALHERWHPDVAIAA